MGARGIIFNELSVPRGACPASTALETFCDTLQYDSLSRKLLNLLFLNTQPVESLSEEILLKVTC